MSIGKKIKQLRKEKGMTQKELGDKCGIADSAIRRYELGGANPKFITLIKIAAALEVNVFDIIDPKDYRDLSRLEAEETVKKGIESGKYRILQDDEIDLANNYLKLNELGKKEALKRVEELTEIPKYVKTIELFTGITDIKKDLGIYGDINTVIELNTDTEENQD